VAVGIGFDDGDDAWGRTIRGTQVTGDGAAVAADGVEIDARDRRTNHGVPCARFSKRENSLMNASFAVPVGPLRCLPMMISAVP